MKKVAITGATGMIGIALVHYLVSKNIECLLLVKPEFIKEGSLPKSDLVKLVDCDLNEMDKFDYPEHDFDTFIHMGWVATIGNNRDNADLQEKNIKITLDAVRAAHKLGCKVFMGTGSQAEFGYQTTKLSSSLGCNPTSGYGIAKFAAGKLSGLLANQLGMRHNWVRILSIYGPYDNPNTLISYVINSLLNNTSPELTKCEQDWDYLYVEDCARAIYSIAEKGVNNKVYPIGGGKTRKLSEYVKEIKDVIGTSTELRFGAKEYPLHQPMFLCADISDLTKDTGFVPKVSFEDGISRTIDFIKSHN